MARRIFAPALFSLSLLFFMERGPYRALRDSRTGDFATVYAASRCWLHRENPYARADINLELSRSGAPASLIREQDQHVSGYPISVMPFVAVLAWLPWRVANATWCLFSIGCFTASILALSQTFVSLSGKLMAATCCLFFSPTYVGILNGNPSVFTISLTILSLYYAQRNRHWITGALFAISLCAKPQIALCSVLAFLIWKRWTPLFLGLATAAVVTIFATLWVSSFGQNWDFWISLKQNAALLAVPGGLIDPRPSSPYAAGFLNAQTLSYVLIHNAALAESVVFASMLGMLALYVYSRARDDAADTRIDSAFLAAITLAVAYHRYYDGQLLLVLIPAIAYLWRIGRARIASLLAVCFALIAFPLQSFFERFAGPPTTHSVLTQLVLFRHQPAAVVTIALILSLRW